MSSINTGTPSPGAILRAVIDKRLAATGVALPGTVVSYDASSRTCTVRPGVHRLVPALDDDDDDVVEPLAALQEVPVCWPCGRGFMFADVSLAPGDPVLLICMDRDTSGWRRGGEPSAPDDARAHHWSSAVAIPGLVPDRNPITPPTDAAALASKLDFLIQKLLLVVPAPVAGVDAGEPGLLALQAALKLAGWNLPGFSTGSAVLKLGG